MLKKLICAFLGIVLCCGMVVSVSAAGNTYYVDEAGLKITLPYGMTVFTRDMEADDPSFALLGVTKSQVEEMLKASYAFLDAVSYDNSYEVIVNVQETEVALSDFNEMSDSEISSFGNGLLEGMKSKGSEKIEFEIYQHKQTKFTKIYTRRLISDNYIYTLTYTTVVGGKCISVIFSSLNGIITNVLDFTANEIVDSVQFDKVTAIDSSKTGSASSSDLIYTDKETNTTFTVPAGWSQKPLTETRQYIDVKYVNDENETILIMYGSTDLWSEMSASDKNGLSRSDLDSNYFTAGELAAAMGLEADRITTATYNGITYYKFVTEIDGSDIIPGFNYNLTLLLYVKNGYMYGFQYSGSDDYLSTDFVRLMNSVKYGTGQTASSVSSKTSSAVSKTSSVASTAAFTYTDSETQTTFTVPSNWSKKSLSKTRQYIDTKFVYNQDSEGIIMYGSTDLWAEMSDADKIGLSRADFNNALFTAADLAEAMNVNADQVKTVKYNDISYYKIVTSVPIEMPGSNLTVTMTMLLNADNGYLYAFYFNGTSSSPYYKDFEALLRSVKYAEPIIMSSVPLQTSSPVSSEPVAAQPGQSDGGNSVWAVVITLLIFAAPIIIYRYAIAKKPSQPSGALMITIFYGLGAAAVTALLAVIFDIGFACVGAVILWSFVNYLMLVKGRKQVVAVASEYFDRPDEPMIHIEQPQELHGQNAAEAERTAAEEKPAAAVITITTEKTEAVENPAESANVQESPEEAEKPNFCYNCGAKLRAESKFCPKCGTKVEKLGDE